MMLGLRAPHRQWQAAVVMLLLCLLELPASGGELASQPELQVVPQHFVLQPGERIHYTVCERSRYSKPRCTDAKFTVADPNIVRMIDPKGIFEAVASGHTQVLVRTATARRGINVEVRGPAVPPIASVPYSTVHEIKSNDSLLFVGHANLDGFDHTAVAKPGIDRLVREAKQKNWPVVYFVSDEYPNWYTADRRPDYALTSEGQEHNIRVSAQRVIFSGGDFMFCTLRNVQMTLHGMLQESATRRIDFVFPSEAIWVEDLWGPGEKQPYPAPMVLLATLFARRQNDAQRYSEVVFPFLKRVIEQYPVLNYPADPPKPPLADLLKDWSIVVRLGDHFERVYRSGNPDKIVLLEFPDV